MKKGARKKSNQVDGAHKRLAVGSPQMVEPPTSHPPYVPVSDSKSTKTNGNVMCLDSRENGDLNACNDLACVQEMERA